LNNKIHPTTVISTSAIVGNNNKFGPNCYVGPNVRIGDNNNFEGFVSIGMPAEHRSFFGQYGTIEIGNDNVIREFVTINSSTFGTTKMGNSCIMLRGSHLSHDSILEDNVNVSCNVLIGGETRVMYGANLGLGCIIHQRQLIGSLAMIGMGCVITKSQEIAPGGVYVGNPAKLIKSNKVGITRAGFNDEDMKKEVERFYILRGVKC
jgi:UDP-N-acetylglucosamine acyltransferase